MKRTLAFVCLAVLVLMAGLSGCSQQSSPTEIRGYFASSPETIDPTMNSSMDGATYLVHLFQGLYRFKWDGTGIEFGDAESVDISDDGLVWTFHLRDRLKWSDGQMLSAYDYQYAWRRLCNPEVAAPYGYDIGAFIKNGVEALDGEVAPEEIGVKVIDDKTFEVTLSGPCPFFDQVAAFPVLYPVRSDAVVGEEDTWWTNPTTYYTNGPFMMQSFTADKELVIVPNPQYYDKVNIAPTKITFKFLADENAGLAALRANEIDIANQCPPDESTKLKEEGLFDLRDQLGTYYISFNSDKEPFDNALVRKAFSLAADRDFLSETVMLNTRTPATAMVCPGFADLATGSDFRTVGGEFISTDYEANKAEAKKALAEAGYPDGKDFPVVEYVYNESSVHETIAEALAKSWEEVLGVKVTLAKQEWGTFLETRRKGNFSIARNGWISDWMDPSSMLTIFVSGGGNNDGNYSNPDFDAYIAESYASSDQSVRLTALHNAEKVLMEDWGCAPLMFYKESFIVNKDLKDWHHLTLGYTLLHMAHK